MFRNLFTFTSVSTEVTDILLRLTEDSQIEVRAVIIFLICNIPGAHNPKGRSVKLVHVC